MQEFIIKVFLTIVGTFFSVGAIMFLTNTEVYNDLLTKIVVFLGMIIIGIISFLASHAYKED